MPITKPPVLPAWADSGDKVQPTNAEISAGWPASNTPPSRQRFNWIFNYCANAVRYFCRRGIPDYDNAETYMTGDRVIGDDGNTYRSKIDSNIGHTPSTSATQWEVWGLTNNQADARITNGFSVKSHAATGYQKMPGGLILQWGLGNTSGTSATITFPIPFPNACFFASGSDLEAVPANIKKIGTASISTSQASFAFDAAPGNYYWFAIGN